MQHNERQGPENEEPEKPKYPLELQRLLNREKALADLLEMIADAAEKGAQKPKEALENRGRIPQQMSLDFQERTATDEGSPNTPR